MAKRKKRFSKGLTIFLAIVLLISGAVVGFMGCDSLDVVKGGNYGQDATTPLESTGGVYASGDMEIHFLELGNKYTGDCTYIKAGENDILIDAGSRTSSIPTIDAYLSEYVTDGTLEFVIVTHAHEDHYAGFATGEKTDSLFDLYDCEIIIDFAEVTQSKEDSLKEGKNSMYKNYLRERDAEVAAGAVHYTARECMEQDKNIFSLGEGMSLEILDSAFYYKKADSENDHSVCTMIHDGDRNYLFTGDLEKEGEEELVKLNDLPKVDLYKAGHHGSKTSSHDVLLSVIRPDIVCVCCCCGSQEYTKVEENQFPTQQFIDRIAPYTDKVYVTTLSVDYEAGEFTSMNGNIVILSKKTGLEINCSNNNTKLKDTEWFKANRTVPDPWK